MMFSTYIVLHEKFKIYILYIYIYIRYKYEEETTMYFWSHFFFKDDANVCECVNKKKKILLN